MVRRITNTPDIGGAPAPRPIHTNTKGVTLPQAVSHPFISHQPSPLFSSEASAPCILAILTHLRVRVKICILTHPPRPPQSVWGRHPARLCALSICAGNPQSVWGRHPAHLCALSICAGNPQLVLSRHPVRLLADRAYPSPQYSRNDTLNSVYHTRLFLCSPRPAKNRCYVKKFTYDVIFFTYDVSFFT